MINSTLPPQARQDTSVRRLLRQATHEFHETLNRHPLLAGLGGTESSLDDYHRVISAFFHIYRGLEYRIIRYLAARPGVFDYAGRTKLPWLLDDLGMFPDEAHVDRPISAGIREFPEITETGALIGLLYVIEGSTLGGQVVSHGLAKRHGVTGSNGGRFYHGYGENTASMWRDFLGFAESIADDSEQCEIAIGFACETFRLFIRVLDEFFHGNQAVGAASQ